MSSSGFHDREYENLVREAITAARGRKFLLARRLLERAAGMNPTDTRVWLWLSATTRDPVEQRDFLEKAVAADPNNAAAKKGLAILAGQMGESVPDLPQKGLSDGYVPPDPEKIDPQRTFEGTTTTFACANCGGRLNHPPGMHEIVCEYCGHRQATGADYIADEAEMPFEPALQTGLAHAWAASAHEVVCEKCGAHSFEPSGVHTQRCPYCGSNQLVDSEQLDTLIDPQVIALFVIDQEQALAGAHKWLEEGYFTPDDLIARTAIRELRPAFYPFWTFDGGVEVRWTAEVRRTYGRSTRGNPEWELVKGFSVQFFDDVLIPGVSVLEQRFVDELAPFALKKVIGFEPEHLAGWPAMAYDRPLSDASLLAREIVMGQVRPKVRGQIEPGREKREVRIGAGSWSGVTYKHVLLPLWVGSFVYRGQTYRVFVNGQTGKVGGEKPKDRVKSAGLWLIGLSGLLLIAILVYWYLSGFVF